MPEREEVILFDCGKERKRSGRGRTLRLSKGKSGAEEDFLE